MTVEERLRRAMDAEAETVDVDPADWDRVQARLSARTTWRRGAILVTAAAAVIAVAVGVVVTNDDDGAVQQRTVDAVPADDPPAPPGPPSAEEAWPGIWPFESADAVDAYIAEPGVGMFFDAEATALEFARVYLGMPDPVSSSGFVATADGSSGGVAIKEKPTSNILTRINVQRVGGADGPYVVVGADTDNIRVERPLNGHLVGPDVVVAGTSTAFEATVDVEVRQDGQVAGESLGSTFVMGGSMGEFGPFEGRLTIEPPTAAAGAVVFTTESAEDGSVQEATVVRVVLAPAGPAVGTSFSVFFNADDGETLVEVERETARTDGVLRAALESLFAGPRPEDGAGLSSLFSAETADLLAGVNLTADGTAAVDLADEVNNASTSAGSALFLEALDATVFQFPTVQRVEYRLRGSCEAFWTWLQVGECQVVERPPAP